MSDHTMTSMSARGDRVWLRLAQVGWVILALSTLGLTLASVPSYFASLHHVLPTTDTPDFNGQLTASANGSDLIALGLSIDFYARYSVVLALASWLMFALVGLVIFLRKSGDRMALLVAYTLLLAPIAISPNNLNTLPHAWQFAVSVLQLLGDIGFALVFYLFPGGTFAPRWTRVAAVATLIFWMVDIFAPPTFTDTLISFLVYLALEASLVIAQIVRYRRVSTPRERQQTKWVVYGLVIGLGGVLIEIVVLYVILPALFKPGALVFMAGSLIQTALVACIPLSFAIAILRSQLWDIDALINRTLVYGLLTGILALVYFGSVLLLGNLARNLTGRENSAPVIVISTLAIAALFQPLRGRIQSIIDRRFYRRKYDAAHTIAAFSASLHSSVDLRDLTNQLLAAVDSTMQPSHLSLWLSPRQHARPDNSTNEQRTGR